MNFFAFSGLVNGLVSTLCGVVVWAQNPRERKNWTFALFCASLALWSFFYAAWQMADNATDALFRARGLMMGAILVPILVYQHALALYGLETPVRRWIRRWVLWPVTLLFLAVNTTPWFVASVEARSRFPYWPVPGPLFHPFLVLFLALALLAYRMIWRFRRTAPAPVRNEIAWIGMATALGWLGGGSNYFLWYNIPVIPYPTITVSLYALISSLLFFRLGMIEVRTALKHVSMVLLIYGSLVLLALAATLPLTRHLLNAPGADPIFILAGVGCVVGAVLSVGPVIYAVVVKRMFWLRGHQTTGLAHELKSPLSNILGALEVLEDELAPAATSQAKEYLRMIRSNSARLSTQVEALLTLSKVQRHQMALSRSQFSLQDLVAEVVEQHTAAAQAKGVRIEVLTSTRGLVQADRDKMALVVSNLLSNAVKFSKETPVQIFLEESDRAIRLSVKDHGCGIASSDLPRIFETFFQAEGVAKGSGLGLSIAKGLTEAHGGRLWAESPGLGQGATFTVELPRHPSPQFPSKFTIR